MSMRPVGMISDLSAAAAGAFKRIEIDPTRVIQCTEFQISLNAAPNDTNAPIEWDIERATAAATGVAAVVVNVNDDIGQTIGASGLVECTANGALADTLHRQFVPNVSGYNWVAGPGHAFDCLAAEFLGLRNVSALPAGISAACYMYWEE